MEDIQENSAESSSPLYSPRVEPDTPDYLNNACLLNESDFLLEEPGGSSELSSTIVPETPSPLTYRRRRYSQKDVNMSAATSTDSDKKLEFRENIPGYLTTTPSSQRTLKRRKLDDSDPNTSACGNSSSIPEANGFVTASSLLPSEFLWLESPRPSASSFFPAFSSVKPSSSAGSSTCALGQPSTSDQTCLNGSLTRGRTAKQKTQSTNTGRKKTNNIKTRSRTSKNAPEETKTDFPMHGIQDEGLPLDPERLCGPSNAFTYHIPEDIVVIEDDADDDDASERMVRSVQMAEDEAYARSLQEQFNIEQRMEQEQRRQQSRPPNRNHHSAMVDPYVGLGWIPPWASMINSASFSHGAPEFQHIMFGEPPHRQQGQRQTGRGRNSRRRPTSNLQMDVFDDSQGNNYEALLAFEEQQGSVVAKNTLSKAEIERLPIKAYDPAHSAGKTDCQICFCEYKKGERLRMLPCLHDYHVKCIDRWLKENATCPICRADITTCGDFS